MCVTKPTSAENAAQQPERCENVLFVASTSIEMNLDDGGAAKIPIHPIHESHRPMCCERIRRAQRAMRVFCEKRTMAHTTFDANSSNRSRQHTQQSGALLCSAHKILFLVSFFFFFFFLFYSISAALGLKHWNSKRYKNSSSKSCSTPHSRFRGVFTAKRPGAHER